MFVLNNNLEIHKINDTMVIFSQESVFVMKTFEQGLLNVYLKSKSVDELKTNLESIYKGDKTRIFSEAYEFLLMLISNKVLTIQ